ncbi:MAG: mannose-1-phosphate guanylyltransferase [Bernardetiaceae bacterium]|nr:mannose-1-phosphate guanylyltransferase [Bernardetiaceae bacterium]
MKHPHNYLIIMAGGIGSRFWPFSRNYFPKQFQDILDTGKTLLQQTAQRFKPLCPEENIFIVTNKKYAGLVKHQLPFLSDEQILLEPIMRNTAPCIAYAAYKIREKDPEANIIISPSDHLIIDTYSFIEQIEIALKDSRYQDKIITLGIKPTRPDTGYGYIQTETRQYDTIKKVKLFTEKPNAQLAEAFLESGDFLWNAGIFIANVQTLTHAFEKYQCDIADAFEEMRTAFYTTSEPVLLKKAYSHCHPISIDYGIMEKADNVYVVPCDCGWSDLGTWKSLYEVMPKDKNKNVVSGNIIAHETTNCIVKTPKDRLVVLQGLDNMIIAEHDNVLLICKKDEEQRIKNFREEAQTKKGEKFC